MSGGTWLQISCEMEFLTAEYDVCRPVWPWPFHLFFAAIILLTLKSLQSCDIIRRLMMADDLAVILALLRILHIMIL